jgi:hypothetical protein
VSKFHYYRFLCNIKDMRLVWSLPITNISLVASTICAHKYALYENRLLWDHIVPSRF